MMVYTLGEKIRLKRKERNMTLKDLAGDRITPGQISLVESGKSNPSNDLLQYMADRFNINIEYFLETEEVQAKKICEYYINIAEVSLYLNKQEKAIMAVDEGLLLSKKYNLYNDTGILEFIKARLKFANSEFEEAQQHCISANRFFLKENNIEYSVKSFILLGNISFEMGYLNTAMNYFSQAEAMLTENNFISESLRAELYHNISKCYIKSNNSSKALGYANIIKQKLEVLGDKQKYTETLLDKCIQSGEGNNIEEALNYSREAQKFFSQVVEVHNIAEIETNLGEIFSKTRKYEESSKHFDNAIQLKTYINDNSLAYTMLKMSQGFYENNDCEKALRILKKMDHLLSEEQHFYKIKSYEHFFSIYYKMGDKTKAEEVLLEGIKYVEGLNYKRQLGDLYSLLGKLYIETNNKELALDYISRSIDIYKELGIILSD
jgi:transcriptional regulator with XRE-family HTH domain